MAHLGEIAALITALMWALCSLAFGLASRRVGAAAVNQLRLIAAATALLVAHRLAFGCWWPELADAQLGWLAASSIAGLAIGDLMYFHSVAVLGPRLGTLLMATAPLFCAAIAWPLLGEPLTALSLLGIAVTSVGVVVVLQDRNDVAAWLPPAGRAKRGVAIAAGLGGALGQALGLVFAKLGMQTPVDGGGAIDPLSATLVRMVIAAAAALLLAAALGRLGATRRALGDRRALAAIGVGVLFGPTLGVWLSLLAVSLTDAGIAATLNATTPIFMIGIARVAYGSRPTRLAVLGTALAVAGSALLFTA